LAIIKDRSLIPCHFDRSYRFYLRLCDMDKADIRYLCTNLPQLSPILRIPDKKLLSRPYGFCRSLLAHKDIDTFWGCLVSYCPPSVALAQKLVEHLPIGRLRLPCYQTQKQKTKTLSENFP
jgi:hypothetical protein